MFTVNMQKCCVKSCEPLEHTKSYCFSSRLLVKNLGFELLDAPPFCIIVPLLNPFCQYKLLPANPKTFDLNQLRNASLPPVSTVNVSAAGNLIGGISISDMEDRVCNTNTTSKLCKS